MLKEYNNKQLLTLYDTYNTEYNIVQTHLFNYSQYVQKYKHTGKIYSAKELLDQRTEIWHKLNPIILELRRRNIDTEEIKGQKRITDWIK